MALAIVGIGLNPPESITQRGLSLVKEASIVFLEVYTAPLSCSWEFLEKSLGKKIEPATRTIVEKESEQKIIIPARDNLIVLLVMGDPLAATTHTDIMDRARKEGVVVEIVGNESVCTAVARTGLQLYKFGKVTSIPFPQEGYEPESPYNTLKENNSVGAHTLFLLDLDPPHDRYLSIADAIRALLRLEIRRGERLFGDTTVCVGCARLGQPLQKIVAGTARQLLKEDFGKAPYCLIVPSKNLHFVEEEWMKRWK